MFFAIALLRVQAEPAVLAEFPFQFREGLLWVEVAVPQSEKPLNVLLDTGASVSVLNLKTAQRLGLSLGSPVSVTGVGTTLTGNWPVRLSATADKVELPGKFLALDLSKLSGACSNSVDGLIGADFFCDRVVQIDYHGQKLRVLDSKPLSEGAEAIPLEVRRCGMRVVVSVNGHKQQWVRLDTGCATALQWVTTYVPSRQCATKLAVGLSQISIPQTKTTLKLGNQQLDRVETGVHRQAIFPGECGLLGNGLLARFGTVTIDTKSGRLYLGSGLAE